MNKVAKAQANFSHVSWVQLHVPTVSDQHKEVERAVYKMGEHQLRESIITWKWTVPAGSKWHRAANMTPSESV